MCGSVKTSHSRTDHSNLCSFVTRALTKTITGTSRHKLDSPGKPLRVSEVASEGITDEQEQWDPGDRHLFVIFLKYTGKSPLPVQ